MEKLIDILRSLGFSEYESRIYFYLIRESPKTGYQVSQDTGIHRANTYQALESLLKKEAVISDDSKPKLYRAVEPEDLLSRIQSDFTYSIQNLREELLKYKGSSRDRNLFTFRGYHPMIEKLRQVLGEVRAETAAVLGMPELKTLRNELEAANGRINRFLCLTYHTVPNNYGIQVLQVPPELWVMKSERGEERRIIVAERASQAVFGTVNDAEPDRIVSYWTRNPGVVFSHYELLVCAGRAIQNS